jgi:transcriptional regulator with XRE-family HTH domain
MATLRETVASGGTPEEDGDVRFLRRLVAILAATRKAKGLTLRELGKSTGYNWGYLSRAERGLTQPGVVSLCKWCRALDLSFAEAVREASQGG